MATSTATKTGRAPLSDEHKKALAEGRTHGRTVQDYLDALTEHKPKRGRKRTIQRVREELEAVEQALPEATSTRRLILLQKQIDLQKELDNAQDEFDITPLEEAFVKVAKAYSHSKGITYRAWKDVGVAPAVLKRAGITRAGNGNGNGSK